MVNKNIKQKFKIKNLFILVLIFSFILSIFYFNKEKSENINTYLNKKDQEKKQYIDKNVFSLILVNKKNPLPQNFSVNLKNINQSSKHKVDERIYEDLKNMLNDSKKENIDLLISSSYRTKEESDVLHKQQVNYYLSLGYNKEEAVKEASSWVAPPGTSEHHTGLALDIVTPKYQNLDHGYADTDAGKWLKDNAYKYGFILRYPKGKEDITEISFEPWHYRYVGIEHAKKIYESNLCLEEYLLKN